MIQKKSERQETEFVLVDAKDGSVIERLQTS
jgi:hypothetical protein